MATMMEASGLYDLWSCKLSLDGMQPGQTPLPSTFCLRFWPNGGISGIKQKPMADLDRLLPNQASRGEEMTVSRMFRMAGDVYGVWTQQGVDFTLLTRDKVGKYQFKGKWAEFLSYVKEGNCRFGAEMMSDSMVTTLGTFQLIKKDKQQEEEDVPVLSSFCANLKRYTETASPDRLFYDFHIEARDGTLLPTHKFVLASQTRYFEGLFRQENPDQVSLDFDSDVIKKFLNYLYTGHIDIDGSDVQDVLMFANYIAIQDVVTKCEIFIANNLDTTNCLDVLNFGYQIANESVTKAALDVTCRNFQNVFSDPVQLSSLSLPLYRRILASDSLLLYSKFGTLLTGQYREKALEEYIQRYVDMGGHNEDVSKELRTLLRLEETSIMREGGLGLTYTVGNAALMGRPGDNPRTQREFKVEGAGKKWIRGVKVRTTQWDGRDVVGGLVLVWSDGSHDCLGVEEDEASNIPLLEVEEGQHISFILGSSGWYVDCLAFVTSCGKLLGSQGPIGGDGGGFRHTLHLLKPKFNSSNTYLDGVKGKVVTSQNVTLVTNLKFVYRIAADHGTDPERLESSSYGRMESSSSEDDSDEDGVNEIWNSDGDFVDDDNVDYDSEEDGPVVESDDDGEDWANVIPGQGLPGQ